MMATWIYLPGLRFRMYVYEQVSTSGQSKFIKREDVKLPFVDDSDEFFLSFGDINEGMVMRT